MNDKAIKLKPCKICTGDFAPFSTTQRVCSPTCAIEFNRQKDIKKTKLKDSARKKAFYGNDRAFRKKAAQTAFNAFVRKRDEALPCISCGREHKGQYHAGHFKTTGASPELRFDEDNCHKQCAPCNNHLSGNIENYLPNLIKKIGAERYRKLIGPQKKLKLTAYDFKDIEIKYKGMLKNLTRTV